MIRRVAAFYRLELELLWRWRPGRRALIRRSIISFLVGIVSLALAIAITPGISVTGLGSVAVGVVVLAALNLLVRPVMLAAFAALNPIVLVIGTLVFQVVAFLLLGRWVEGIQVNGFLAAFVGSWVYAIVNTLLTSILATDDDESYWGTLVRQMALKRGDAIRSESPGVVIIQIDGLAHPILAHQVRAGRVPHMARWIRSREMRLDRWTALLPSQTSASQAGILHGNNSFIPAFRWWEKDRGRMMVSNHPEDAAEIVRRASDGEGLLSNDGASVGNLVSGDAARSYVTMSTIKDRTQGLAKSRAFYSFFASPYNYLHTVVLTFAEVFKEYFQASRTRRRGIDPRMHRGMPYPAARAGTNVALRALSTSLVMEEMFRGTPVIYVDYTDYDEIAHHSGPERPETLEALDGVDRTVATLVHAAQETPRPYRFVLLSDHGQSLGSTFRQRYGLTLEELIAERMGGNVPTEAATAPSDSWGPINAALSEAAQTEGATGALTRAVTRSSTEDGVVDLSERKLGGRGPREERGTEPAASAAAPVAAGELPELVVAASGNLALVFFPRLPGRVTYEEVERQWPGLVRSLARHEGIGFVLARSAEHGAVALGRNGANYLDQGRVEGTDPVSPYGEHALTGLRRVDGMEHCGDLVVISMLDPDTDEVAAFEELIGSHGGLGGPQTEPFILHPADWVVDEPIVGAEAVYRQLRRWLSGVGIELGSARPAAPRAPAASHPREVPVAAAASTDASPIDATT